MNKYETKTVDGVDFVYIGNDVNGNCRYAVNYRFFLHYYEMHESFESRIAIARERAKRAFFDRERMFAEPYFIIRPCGNYIECVKNIERAKAE